jgi:Ca2+-binding EF-hand superfamily protein
MKKFLIIGSAAAALLTVPSGAQSPQRSHAQPITLAAMQARVQEQFARTDANRDGFVTQAELQTLAAAHPDREQRIANREQRQAKRAQRLARLDTNRDGAISQAERQARRAAVPVSDLAEREARKAQRVERRAQLKAARGERGLRINEQRFARLDANNDGRLSLAEVSARVSIRFAKLDANRDGAISREERRTARVQRAARRNG